MPDTERTVSAVVRRERARRRLRGATAGAGILGVAAGGLVAYYLPGPAHRSNHHSSAGTSSTSRHSAASDDQGNSGSDDHGSGSASNSGSLGSSSAPATSSGPAAATSGGS